MYMILVIQDKSRPRVHSFNSFCVYSLSHKLVLSCKGSKYIHSMISNQDLKREGNPMVHATPENMRCALGYDQKYVLTAMNV